jgi:hypothetical protein
LPEVSKLNAPFVDAISHIANAVGPVPDIVTLMVVAPVVLDRTYAQLSVPPVEPGTVILHPLGTTQVPPLLTDEMFVVEPACRYRRLPDPVDGTEKEHEGLQLRDV